MKIGWWQCEWYYCWWWRPHTKRYGRSVKLMIRKKLIAFKYCVAVVCVRVDLEIHPFPVSCTGKDETRSGQKRRMNGWMNLCKHLHCKEEGGILFCQRGIQKQCQWWAKNEDDGLFESFNAPMSKGGHDLDLSIPKWQSHAQDLFACGSDVWWNLWYHQKQSTW